MEDGIVNTSQVEEHMYEILRKWETDWVKEYFDEKKEFIIDNLTKEQEDILKDIHAEDYMGTDDDMPDDYEYWLCELDYDDLIDYLKLK